MEKSKIFYLNVMLAIVGATLVFGYMTYRVTENTRLLILQGYHQTQKIGTEGILWVK